jgi:dienelactone hydrolase
MLSRAPMRFGAVPWPDDAYLDDAGRVRVRDIPSAAGTAYADALADAMADLDGFGTRPTVYFSFDGELDPRSLPDSAEESLEDSASVFLVDADTSSPQAFDRVAVDVAYAADRREITLRPAHDHALTPGRLYAAVVTRAVKSDDGRAVDGAEQFLAIRDAETPLSDPLERAARARYAPVLETLETLPGHSLPRSRVAALAVFRVQTVRDDLADARVLLRSVSPGAAVVTTALSGSELDNLLGTPLAGAVGLDAAAPHEHIGFMVQGRFESPSFISASPGGHGSFERDAAGLLAPKGRDEVPFSLFLPQGLTDGARLPVVIVQHGYGGERSDALALANALTSAGYAVIAPDAPFHGLRSDGVDRVSRFTGSDDVPDAPDVPDGFGDRPGDFIGEEPTAGVLAQLHPFYYRDAVRQGVVDLMQLVFLLEQGDWSALGVAIPALQNVELVTDRLGFIGLDLGADFGVLLGAAERDVGAYVLAFPYGLTIDSWVRTPGREDLAQAVFDRLSLELPDDEVEASLRLPDVDAWRALSDRASGLAHAPALRRLPANTLVLMARDDEVAHNAGTEELAYALGAQIAGGDPHYALQLMPHELRPGATISGNFEVEGGAVTRVVYVLDPATHTALTHARGSVTVEHPVDRPWTELDDAQEIENPIADALMQVTFFFESYRSCTTMTPAEFCAASVVAPLAP